MACFLLLTCLPFFPLFKLPSFSLCIARLTDRCALLPYLAMFSILLSIDSRIHSDASIIMNHRDLAYQMLVVDSLYTCSLSLERLALTLAYIFHVLSQTRGVHPCMMDMRDPTRAMARSTLGHVGTMRPSRVEVGASDTPHCGCEPAMQCRDEERLRATAIHNPEEYAREPLIKRCPGVDVHHETVRGVYPRVGAHRSAGAVYAHV